MHHYPSSDVGCIGSDRVLDNTHSLNPALGVIQSSSTHMTTCIVSTLHTS
jgi:hypothetical protein